MRALTAALLPADGYSIFCGDPSSWAVSAECSPAAFVRGQEMGPRCCGNPAASDNPGTDAKARTDRRSHFTWCKMPREDHKQVWGLCCKRTGRCLPQNRSRREQNWLDPLSWAYADEPPSQLRCTIANMKTSLGTRPLDTTSTPLHTKFISSNFLVLQRKVVALKHGIN